MVRKVVGLIPFCAESACSEPRLHPETAGTGTSPDPAHPPHPVTLRGWIENTVWWMSEISELPCEVIIQIHFTKLNTDSRPEESRRAGELEPQTSGGTGSAGGQLDGQS